MIERKWKKMGEDARRKFLNIYTKRIEIAVERDI